MVRTTKYVSQGRSCHDLKLIEMLDGDVCNKTGIRFTEKLGRMGAELAAGGGKK